MRIRDCFDRGRPVFSFEFFPPKTSQGVENLFRAIGELSPLEPDFVSVTYGAGGSTRALTVELTARIKREIGLEAMAHLTCVGHDAAEIEGTLQTLEAEGIENVLALRGDPPGGSGEFVPPANGFAHASELVGYIRREFNGRFCLGAACYPEGHVDAPDRETDLRNLVTKVRAGVDFLITQLFFDPSDYFAFAARARAAGINLPIVPGIMPVTNRSQVERFTSMCGASIPEELRERLAAAGEDEAGVIRVGVDWATEQCRALLEGGAPGIHFYTLNRSLATRTVWGRLHALRA